MLVLLYDWDPAADTATGSFALVLLLLTLLTHQHAANVERCNQCQ